jgi:hypothetical protein
MTAHEALGLTFDPTLLGIGFVCESSFPAAPALAESDWNRLLYLVGHRALPARYSHVDKLKGANGRSCTAELERGVRWTT